MANNSRAKRFVDWFIRSRYFEMHTEGNTTDWINDPDRAERCAEAAEEGSDGSTHQERIQDFRDAFKDWISDNHRHHDYPTFTDAVDSYFDELELWHEKNGSLFQQIG